MKLTEFLLARIAEDETIAQTARLDEHLRTRDRSTLRAEPSGQLFDRVRCSSGRVLAECEAKRRIVSIEPWSDGGFVDGFHEARELVLRALALPYADHKDYRQEWQA